MEDSEKEQQEIEKQKEIEKEKEKELEREKEKAARIASMALKGINSNSYDKYLCTSSRFSLFLPSHLSLPSPFSTFSTFSHILTINRASCTTSNSFTRWGSSKTQKV